MSYGLALFYTVLIAGFGFGGGYLIGTYLTPYALIPYLLVLSLIGFGVYRYQMKQLKKQRENCPYELAAGKRTSLDVG